MDIILINQIELVCHVLIDAKFVWMVIHVRCVVGEPIVKLQLKQAKKYHILVVVYPAINLVDLVSMRPITAWSVLGATQGWEPNALDS